MRLEQKTKDWIESGFITQSQADQIISYENTKSNWVVFGFYILAAIVISLGVISLVAFNWENIPDTIKLIADFTILIMLAIAAFYYFDQKTELRFDLLLMFFILFCLASIGLIGQVFNLDSPFYVAMLLWSGITFLAVLNTKRAFTWFIWFGFFLGGILFKFLDENWDHGFAAALTLFYLCVIALIYSRKYVANEGYKNALIIWVITGLIINMVLFEIKYRPNVPLLLPNVAAVIAIISLWICERLNYIQKIIASSILLLLLFLPLFANTLIFLPACLSTTILCLCAILAATLRLKKLFNLFIGLAALRAICFYLEALGGLATSGVSLIIVGVIILYLSVLWSKHGKSLLNKIEEWANVRK